MRVIDLMAALEPLPPLAEIKLFIPAQVLQEPQQYVPGDELHPVAVAVPDTPGVLRLKP